MSSIDRPPFPWVGDVDGKKIWHRMGGGIAYQWERGDWTIIFSCGQVKIQGHGDTFSEALSDWHKKAVVSIPVAASAQMNEAARWLEALSAISEEIQHGNS